jgi:hypothetical protein
VLVALSCLLVLLSTTVVWAHRTLLNTGAFVGTVGPVFKNPGVDSAVAARATDQLFAELHLQARLRAALPPKARFAAVPVTNATKGFVAGELTKVLASPKFQAVWTAALTSTHQQLMAVLRGQNTPVLSTSGGYIVLNTVPLINQALGKVSGLVFDLTGKHVTLPTITSAEVPQQAVNKLSAALGVQLPANFGQITLVRSKDLATAQKGVKAFDGLTLVLPPDHPCPHRPGPVAVAEPPPDLAPAGGGRIAADDRGKARSHPRARRAGGPCSQPPARSDCSGRPAARVLRPDRLGPGRGSGCAGHYRAQRTVPLGCGHALMGDADRAQHRGDQGW